MARIAGINIPMNKHVWVGLTHIFGVGRARAQAACEAAGVNPTTKVKDLTEVEVNALRSAVAKFAVEGDLRREVSMNIKRLWIWAPGGDCVTAVDYRCAASARAPTRAPARARASRQ